MEPEPDGCCFDEWASANAERARRKGIAAGITRDLLGALEGAGLEGRTVLDLGCGTGDLALATLARGATRVTGMDLGPGAIREAQALARERRLDDRSSFAVGDAAEASLTPHDVVVLNRVVCCYPRVEALLDNALAAAERVFALTAPISSGLTGLLVRIEIRLANAWYRMRDRKFEGFRAYVHDLDAIDARIREAGFTPVIQGRRRFQWRLAAYERTDRA